MNKIAWSWSRLDLFEQCPRQFQLKNITKEIPFVSSEHLERGQRMHKHMEKAVRGRVLNPEINDTSGKLKRLVDHLRSYDQCWAELKITYDENWNEVDWFSKDAWLRSALDVLAIKGDEAVYIDWKTGKVKEVLTDQNDLMALVIFKKFPNIKKVTTAYVWIDHPAAPPSKDVVSRDDMNWLENDFCDRAEMINITAQTGNWPKKPNPFCKWCEATPEQCSEKRG